MEANLKREDDDLILIEHLLFASTETKGMIARPTSRQIEILKDIILTWPVGEFSTEKIPP